MQGCCWAQALVEADSVALLVLRWKGKGQVGSPLGHPTTYRILTTAPSSLMVPVLVTGIRTPSDTQQAAPVSQARARVKHAVRAGCIGVGYWQHSHTQLVPSSESFFFPPIV